MCECVCGSGWREGGVGELEEGGGERLESNLTRSCGRIVIVM